MEPRHVEASCAGALPVEGMIVLGVAGSHAPCAESPGDVLDVFPVEDFSPAGQVPYLGVATAGGLVLQKGELSAIDDRSEELGHKGGYEVPQGFVRLGEALRAVERSRAVVEQGEVAEAGARWLQDPHVGPKGVARLLQ